jgi:hypothetical protein
MKVNQLETLAILGVLVSFTAACGGSPTSPTAANPSGGGGDAASVKLSALQGVAAGQVCAAQTVTFDDSGNPIPDAPPADTPATTCDAAPAPDQPQADQPQANAAVSDSTSMDSARFVGRLHR